MNDLALVLLPTSDRKLENRWLGPVTVTKVLPRNNYEVYLGHRKAIFHINGLRRFNTDPQETADARSTFAVIDEPDEWSGTRFYGAEH